MKSSSKLRLKHLLTETIGRVCINTYPHESSFSIKGTIGITLSDDRVMVVSFAERIKGDNVQLHQDEVVTDLANTG